ncbi:hypothetical protein LTR62_001484 [Meristemomyces frigidus]|uniref:2-methylcitrate dehydratase PrpD n=1 Tax=Meristemomyces frigidus TaxID=1508187 RepID=A0AAN7YQK1_9PEZI|nr:hypothetical protein LTR62_001484 [Meristemomyces frigidus]
MALTNDSPEANGHSNDTTSSSDSIPATQLLVDFIANTNTTDLTYELREKVKEVLLDFIGVTVGAITHADSTQPILSAITALQGPSVTKTTPGVCSVLGLGAPRFLPHYAGLLNAALGHSLDFDDTYAPGTLHAGVTAIAAALACFESLAAEGQQRSTDLFMLAIGVGYEVTCRLGRELGYEAYSRGFHNTSTAGIFGAIAAIAVLKHLPVQTITMAFGLAGSKAAGSMQYLANGSWNKRLHPGFAVHDAFLCVALAEAGVVGATQIIEGKSGFLNAYTPNPNVSLRRLVGRLGEQWCWLTSSLKPYPACRMTHGFIELSGKLHDGIMSSTEVGILSADAVTSIQLKMTPANFMLVGDPTWNKRHPSNVIDAQFSAYFQVANALVYGAKTGDMEPYSRLADKTIYAVSEKITVVTDKSMSQFGASMAIIWADDETDEVTQQYPLGEVEHPFTKDKVEEKFFSLADPVYGRDKASQIVKAVAALDAQQGSVTPLIEMLK